MSRFHMGLNAVSAGVRPLREPANRPDGVRRETQVRKTRSQDVLDNVTREQINDKGSVTVYAVQQTTNTHDVRVYEGNDDK